MYRELLEKYRDEIGIRFMKIQPPAEADEIGAAEDTVGCRFPAELRALLAELDGDGWLFFSARQIARTVRNVREAFADDYDGIESHLFFAGNGCGDYYCYELEDGAARTDGIYIWEHETNETRRVAENLTELIDRYFNDEI